MSFTLNYTGNEINAILARANSGGEIDDELALKAPLASPALTGTPTAPTQAEGDDSTKIATTEYADRAADAAEAAAEAAAKEYTDAATSALYITDTASGSIASFSDGADGIPMRSVKAQIEPVQDLHGYDSPWPAGGGKNKLTLSELASNASVTVTEVNNPSYTFVGSGATNVFLRGASSLKLAASTAYILTGGVAQIAIRIREYDSGGTLLATHITSGSAALTFTTSANLSYCDAYVVIYTVPSTAITIQPMIRLATESDATFAPYSNECPISGWTGAEVNVTAVNIYDQQWESGSINAATGELVSSTSAIRSKNRIPVYPSTSYRFLYTDGATNVVGIHAYDASGNWLGMYDPGSNVWKTTGGGIGYITNHPVFTTPANAAFIRFRVGGKTTYTEGQISINTPSTVTDYMPFGTTYPVTWQTQAGEVYGGTIDVVSGELTVTHRIFDAGDVNWGKTTTGFYYTGPLDMKVEGSSGVYYPDCICSHFVMDQSGSSRPMYASMYYEFERQFYRTWIFGWNTALTAAEFKTAASGIKFCYELAQPVIYRLSAQQITSLLGQNNVWSNTGDTEVTYVADPKTYIDSKVEALMATISSL